MINLIEYHIEAINIMLRYHKMTPKTTCYIKSHQMKSKCSYVYQLRLRHIDKGNSII